LSHLKQLMLSRPYLSRIPDQELVLDGQRDGLGRIQSTRDGTAGHNDATYLMAYFPEHRRATINTGKLAASELRGWWFNPRTGHATDLGVMPNKKSTAFEPPTNIPGEDWVLVVDAAANGYPAPDFSRHPTINIASNPASAKLGDHPTAQSDESRRGPPKEENP
jgi:hypothetical protein